MLSNIQVLKIRQTKITKEVKIIFINFCMNILSVLYIMLMMWSMGMDKIVDKNMENMMNNTLGKEFIRIIMGRSSS